MEPDYVRKLFLLDDTSIYDAGLDYMLSTMQDFDDYAAFVEAHCAATIPNELRFADFEYLGFSSMRFNRTYVRPTNEHEAYFLAADTSWRRTLRFLAVCSGMDYYDWEALELGDDQFKARMRSRIIAIVDAGEYWRAEPLCAALESFRFSGLPGWLHSPKYLLGPDSAHDLRRCNGKTRGMIAIEFAFHLR